MNDVQLPDLPVLVLDGDQAVIVSPDGDIETFDAEAAALYLIHQPVIACNAPFIKERLDAGNAVIYDVLELFAFVRPAQFCVPTPNGILCALGHAPHHQATQQALALVQCVEQLLHECSVLPEQETVLAIAQAMASINPIWHWAPYVLQAMNMSLTGDVAPYAREKLSKVWKDLPQWEERFPISPQPFKTITPQDTRDQLGRLVDVVVGEKQEPRREQADYASALTAAFVPRTDGGSSSWVIAEAGTGVGKTLGYLAPALAWSTKNDTQIWISTFTRHLQNQLQDDLDHLFPKRQPPAALVRKGRENYLCLLNLEESLEQIQTGDYETRVGYGLMLRWLMSTRSGDLTGGDLPGWMPVLVGTKATLQLADRRGECIHQSCPHYQRCFIERINRDSKEATVIVANHALTLTQLCSQDDENPTLPQHLIFDEGHHLFDASDSAFAVVLSGNETAELKRWVIGENKQKRLRRRGLERRLINLVGESHALWEYVPMIQEAAAFLPEAGWLDRIHKQNPKGLAEEFFAALGRQVLSRADFPKSPYDLECTILPLNDDVKPLAKLFTTKLNELYDRVFGLYQDLQIMQNSDDKAVKRQVGTFMRNLQTRLMEPIQAWQDIVATLDQSSNDAYVQWMGISRNNGRDSDIGIWRHFIDPMRLFADLARDNVKGSIITSATLKPAQGDVTMNWNYAEQRLGGLRLREHGIDPMRVDIPSPFNYAEQTKVILITDVDTDHSHDMGNAYADLFMASGGGALGLFTAIRRLQSAYPIIRQRLGKEHIPLYAQHIDGINTSTLIDIFRAEEDACLLGTDALRDGIDVPGRALRMVVFDRIPWPRPSLLHKARRNYFGGRDYDLFITAMRIRQSFGRLIRTSTDHGVFVMMESALPSKLHSAFPSGVLIEKMPLSQALTTIQGFLSPARSAILAA